MVDAVGAGVFIFCWCSLTYIGLILYLDNFGFLVAAFVLTRHTKKETSLTTKEMFQGVVHAFTPGSGGVLNEDLLFDVGGGLRPGKIRDMAVLAWCSKQTWYNVLDAAGTCESSVRDQAAVEFGLARSLKDVTPPMKEEAEELILEKPECKFMVKALEVGYTAAMQELGLKVSKGPGFGKGNCQAVVWRPIGGTWSEPCHTAFEAAVAMKLCTRDDGTNCEAVKVVGFLRRKVARDGQLYRDAVKKFEVKGAYDDEEEATSLRCRSAARSACAAPPSRGRMRCGSSAAAAAPVVGGRRTSTGAATRRPRRIWQPVSWARRGRPAAAEVAAGSAAMEETASRRRRRPRARARRRRRLPGRRRRSRRSRGATAPRRAGGILGRHWGEGRIYVSVNQ